MVKAKRVDSVKAVPATTSFKAWVVVKKTESHKPLTIHRFKVDALADLVSPELEEVREVQVTFF